MANLLTTIAPKSDQLNADDLIGRTLTIKITKVLLLGGKDETQPVAIHFDGDNGKPYKPCKSMRRVLVQIWGGDGSQYVGRSMTLYRDEKVKFGGADVGGIRISHLSHMNEAVTIALTASKQSRKPYTVKPLINGATSNQAPAAAQTAAQAPAPIDPTVKEAGELAAMGGVATYKAWLSTLTDEVKATVRPYHGAWTTAAKKADEAPKEQPQVDELEF